MSLEPRQIRPDPDALLAQVKAEEQKQQRGKLKIFFGFAAGVGKTYAMLSAGRAKAAEDMDVVIGYAEPHARPDTEMLLLGMDILPFRVVDYRGTALREFDLDAALKRKPELLLVDELAHTNAPGSRHAKRWQDVEELLQAGIHVFTTLNVQHLESLNDVVAQITSIVVRETLPDAIFEQADEVELVDLAPDQLLERLGEGKVYVPQQAEQATQSFFRKSNLTALRELALRKTAEQVNAQVQSQRQLQSGQKTWPTAERILVCISPSISSAKVIRSAKRMAVAMHAQWLASYVETPKFRDMPQAQRDQLLHNFRLAERLGAETVTLSGLNPAEEIVNYARSRNVTKIIAGKSDQPWWRDLFFRSTVDQLLRRSGEIDVYVIRGITQDSRSDESRNERTDDASWNIDWSAYGWSLGVLLLCTALAGAMYYLFRLQEQGDLSNLIMVYLVGVVFVAARYGRQTAVVATVLSVGIFDFVFVPPRFTFAVADTQYFITFLVMLGVGLVISTLTVRIREQADASRRRERRTEALYRMTRELAGTGGLSQAAETGIRHLNEVFHSQSAVLMPDDKGELTVRATADAAIAMETSEHAVAQWAFEHRQMAGRGTDTLPASEAVYIPLTAARGIIGVVAMKAMDSQQLFGPEQKLLLDAFINQIALAIERFSMAQQVRQAQVQTETEKLRSSLLSSVSHDLRTPLAVITGASSSLLDRHACDPITQRELIQTISDESQRLTRLVGNLLDITRLESGAVKLNKQWHPLEEIVGSALHHLESQFAGRRVEVVLPADLPLVPVDGVLIEQVFINLVENAVKYTADNSPIRIEAEAKNNAVIISISDHGQGITPGEELHVFEKFYRGSLAGSQRGAGLGLPICQAIITAHGGTISVSNREAPEHGAIFRFSLPVEGEQPRMLELPEAPNPEK